MDQPPSTPAAASGRKHVGQVAFAADGRARAVLFEGRRLPVSPADGHAAAQRVGEAARNSNLYIDPQSFDLYDQLGNRLAGTLPPG